MKKSSILPRLRKIYPIFGLLLLAGPNISMAAEGNSSLPILSTQQCADEWLGAQRLALGYNLRPDGNSLLVSRAEEQVQANVGGDAWVGARQDAFEKARLQAMAEMVQYFKEGVESGEILQVMQAGDGQALPEEYDQAVDILTLPERVPEMEPVQLDAEIAKVSSEPQGADETVDQKREKLLRLQSTLLQRIKARAINLLNGVTIGTQCEGPSEFDGTVTSGKYSVSVTLIWSPKLAKLARNMFSSSVEIQNGDAQMSIAERFLAQSKDDPNWMASVLGVRVFKDENGEMVVVGFGAAPATSLKSIDESRADLIARNYIAQFKAANVESIRGAEFATLYREFGTPESGVFSDAGNFEARVEEITPNMTLVGVYPLFTWRGKHPVSGTGLVVVARAWKPSAQKDAEAISPTLAPAAETPKEDGPAGAVDSPVRSGLTVNTDTY